MTDRDWFLEFESEARARGDRQRQRLASLVYEADAHRETDPDRMLALIEEGRTLARVLAEPWWALFYDDRRAGALMKYKGDVRTGLEMAVRNALEARKPHFAQFPWRFRIHDHLVVGYLNTDPVGHADRIREALAWLEQDLPPDGSPKYLVLARRRWLAAELGQHEEAEELARRGLALAADDPDQWTARSHAVFCFSHLCEIAWLKGDLAALADAARVGEELARATSHILELAEFLTWQAVLARQAGDPDRAARLFRQGERRVAQLGMPPDHIYFDAACAFHELAGDLVEALTVRHRELSLLIGKGRWAAETRCRIRLCRLLPRLDLPLAEELTLARESAQRLRLPQAPLDELKAIERGR
jgi:tetratricopeptide (TPR) repeat protein